MSMVLILGSVWAYRAWGTYWQWDPKETAALFTWLIYGVYLHTRSLAGLAREPQCGDLAGRIRRGGLHLLRELRLRRAPRVWRSLRARRRLPPTVDPQPNGKELAKVGELAQRSSGLPSPH